MKDVYEMLNDVKIDNNEYEVPELSEIEKKRIKNRLKGKLGKKKTGVRKVVAAASITACLIFGMGSNIQALASIPLIGNVIEQYFGTGSRSFADYKTVIGTAVTDNGITVRLDEVLLDDGQLVISTTFSSEKHNLDKVNAFPHLYINGKEIDGGGSGIAKKNADNSYTFLTNIDISDINIKEKLNIKLDYDSLRIFDKDKSIDGNWVFEFGASGEKLASEIKVIPVNKTFKLENNQEIVVKDIRVTPVSTKLNYSILNGTKYDVHFKLKGQNGVEINSLFAKTLSDNSYYRWGALEEDTSKIKLIPYVISGNEGENKTDNYQMLENNAFTVDLASGKIE